jgi:succinoglycan biosynthesis transport protein ExoP
MSLVPTAGVNADHGQTGITAHARPGIFAAAWAGAKRWWPLAGLAGLIIGGSAATAYYTMVPQKHTVSTILQVTATDPLLSERVNPGQDLEYRKAQASLIHTRKVIQKALETKKVAESALLRDRPDPAGWLEVELKTLVLDGGLIRVSLTGESPDEISTILNEVTNTYLKEIVDAEEDQRRQREGALESILTLSEDRVRLQRSNLRSLAETLHTSDTQALSFKQQSILQRHALLQNELYVLESKLRNARSQLQVLKSNSEAKKIAANGGILGGLAEVMFKSNPEASMSEPIPESLLLDAMAVDPIVKPANDEVLRLRAQLDNAKDSITPGSKVHQEMTKALRSAEAKLEMVREQRRESIMRYARELMYRQAKNSIENLEATVQSLETERKELSKAVDDARLEAEKIGMGSFELEIKRAEIAEAEVILHRLRSEKERLAIERQTIERQTNKRRVIVISPAEANAAKPAASTLTATIGLGFAGFSLGFLGVGYLESRRRRLVHTRDVVQVTKLRVFGSVPLVPGLQSCPLTEVWGSRFGIAGTILVENVNDIRTVLLASGEEKSLKVIMLTSASQGEGKTTLACMLALSMAQIGKRTLLIDGDLRNPQVAERLGLPFTAGFGELLRREAQPSDVIGTVPETPLAVITSGRPCTNLIRGLSVERVRKVFAELREQFDYIIVDSCPTAVSDGLVIGACTDAALLVVRSGHSEEPLVREACERMVAGRVPLLGGILNGLPLARRLRYPYIAVPPVAPAADDELLMAEPE